MVILTIITTAADTSVNMGECPQVAVFLQSASWACWIASSVGRDARIRHRRRMNEKDPMSAAELLIVLISPPSIVRHVQPPTGGGVPPPQEEIENAV
jgi:hypothetical protein